MICAGTFAKLRPSVKASRRAERAILNEQLEWKDIVAANPNARTAFRGEPKKELLKKGQVLCRVITTEPEKKKPGTNIFPSSWWMEWTAAWEMISRFSPVPPREVVRAKWAVTEPFSRELDGLVQIILTQPVYCWKGMAQHQEDKARRVTYLGGGTQLYIPNLAADPAGLSSRVAYMHCFTSTESLKS